MFIKGCISIKKIETISVTSMMAIFFIRKKSIGEKFKFSTQWYLNLGWKYLPCRFSTSMLMKQVLKGPETQNKCHVLRKQLYEKSIRCIILY
jgi:hypothetical protein